MTDPSNLSPRIVEASTHRGWAILAAQRTGYVTEFGSASLLGESLATKATERIESAKRADHADDADRLCTQAVLDIARAAFAIAEVRYTEVDERLERRLRFYRLRMLPYSGLPPATYFADMRGVARVLLPPHWVSGNERGGLSGVADPYHPDDWLDSVNCFDEAREHLLNMEQRLNQRSRRRALILLTPLFAIAGWVNRQLPFLDW